MTEMERDSASAERQAHLTHFRRLNAHLASLPSLKTVRELSGKRVNGCVSVAGEARDHEWEEMLKPPTASHRQTQLKEVCCGVRFRCVTRSDQINRRTLAALKDESEWWSTCLPEDLGG